MKRALSRSVAIALATAGILGAVEFVHFRRTARTISPGSASRRIQSAVVRDDGFAVARVGDAIYTCSVVHCFGPLCGDFLVLLCAGHAGIG